MASASVQLNHSCGITFGRQRLVKAATSQIYQALPVISLPMHSNITSSTFVPPYVVPLDLVSIMSAV